MTETKLLNEYLKTRGTSITGQVIYRLVWSEDIFENRYGFYRDFTKEGLFIREITETRRVKKYNYIHERYILEKWAPGNLTASPETPDASNGDYLPIYVFEDKKGNHLAPTRKVVEFLVSACEGKVDKDAVIDERIIEEKEIAYMVDSFDDHPGYFNTYGPARNAVAYSSGLKGK